MPKIIVEIEWDNPDELWLNADNVSVALHAYCKNTNFTVKPHNNKIVAELLPSEQLELIKPEDNNNNQSPKAGPQSAKFWALGG